MPKKKNKHTHKIEQQMRLYPNPDWKKTEREHINNNSNYNNKKIENEFKMK